MYNCIMSAIKGIIFLLAGLFPSSRVSIVERDEYQ